MIIKNIINSTIKIILLMLFSGVSISSFAQFMGYKDSILFIVNRREKLEQCNYGIELLIDSSDYNFIYSKPKFNINKQSTIVSSLPQIIEKNIILDSLQKELGFRYQNTPNTIGALFPSVPMMLAYYTPEQLKDIISLDAELPCIYVRGGLSEFCVFLIIKENDNFYCLNRKSAQFFFSPISSKEEAISYLCLMENVFPLYDFSFLSQPYDDGFTYQVYKKELNPTLAIEEKDGYIVNMFDDRMHYYCIEITYKVYCDGKIEVIDANKIYSIPIDTVID